MCRQQIWKSVVQTRTYLPLFHLRLNLNRFPRETTAAPTAPPTTATPKNLYGSAVVINYGDQKYALQEHQEKTTILSIDIQEEKERKRFVPLFSGLWTFGKRIGIQFLEWDGGIWAVVGGLARMSQAMSQPQANGSEFN